MIYRLFFPLILSIPFLLGTGSTYDRPDAVAQTGAAWVYDWSRNPPIYDGVESVPMLWGRGDVGRQLGGNSEYVLGFNEPELEAQANLTPVEAAVLWRTVETLYSDHKLVSPANLGVYWLDQFYRAYVDMYGETPQLDAVAFHCYDSYQPNTGRCKQATESFVSWATDRGIDELWVTEWARLPCYPGGNEAAAAFIREMTDYWRSVPEVTRVSYFQATYRGDEPWAFGPMCNTSLVDWDSGELTPVGEAFVGSTQ